MEDGGGRLRTSVTQVRGSLLGVPGSAGSCSVATPSCSADRGVHRCLCSEQLFANVQGSLWLYLEVRGLISPILPTSLCSWPSCWGGGGSIRDQSSISPFLPLKGRQSSIF